MTDEVRDLPCIECWLRCGDSIDLDGCGDGGLSNDVLERGRGLEATLVELVESSFLGSHCLLRRLPSGPARCSFIRYSCKRWFSITSAWYNQNGCGNGSIGCCHGLRRERRCHEWARVPMWRVRSMYLGTTASTMKRYGSYSSSPKGPMACIESWSTVATMPCLHDTSASAVHPCGHRCVSSLIPADVNLNPTLHQHRRYLHPTYPSGERFHRIAVTTSYISSLHPNQWLNQSPQHVYPT